MRSWWWSSELFATSWVAAPENSGRRRRPRLLSTLGIASADACCSLLLYIAGGFGAHSVRCLTVMRGSVVTLRRTGAAQALAGEQHERPSGGDLPSLSSHGPSAIENRDGHKVPTGCGAHYLCPRRKK